MATNKGKGAKAAPKKAKPINWAKIIIPLVMVFVLVGMVFASVINNGPKGGNSGSSSAITKDFNNIANALNLLPSNASYVRYVDMKNDSQLSTWMTSNFGPEMPPAKSLGASPVRDSIAVYPQGYFGDFSQQFVSLTDFGNKKLNVSYTGGTVGGDEVLMVNQLYYFTPATSPVISGRLENIIPVLNIMNTGNNSTAYDTYSDVLGQIAPNHINNKTMELETVGKLTNANFTDMYYAAIGPAPNSSLNDNNKLYSYVAVMRLNQTLSDDQLLEFSLLDQARKQLGFKNYTVELYDKYAILKAQGNLSLCTQDMNQWGFLKY
jgi:hypothetical protein